MEPAASDRSRPGDGAGPPPVPGGWNVLYALVIAGLLAMIALCAAVTRWGGR